MKTPSVTTILAPWSDFSGIRPEVLQAAAERGSKVHRACAAIASGLWAPQMPDEVSGYIESFKSWFHTAVEEVISVEPSFSHPLYGYMGHPDMLARLKGDTGLTLVDYKTPLAQAKSWRLQLAAYAELAEANGQNIQRVIALRLRKTGTLPVVDEYTGTLASNLATFLACLQAWRYFKGA